MPKPQLRRKEAPVDPRPDHGFRRRGNNGMKSLSITLLIAVVCVLSAQVLAAPQIFLRATRARTQNKRDTTWQTSWGSYDKSARRSVAVSIDVRNLESEPVDIIVQTFFIAKGVGRGAAPYVFDRQLDKISLAPKVMTNLVHASCQITARDENYEALGLRYVKGAKVDGYIVRVVAEGQVIKTDASSVKYRKVGKTIDVDQALDGL